MSSSVNLDANEDGTDAWAGQEDDQGNRRIGAGLRPVPQVLQTWRVDGRVPRAVRGIRGDDPQALGDAASRAGRGRRRVAGREASREGESAQGHPEDVFQVE